MPKKLDYTDVKRFVESFGFILKSEIYIGTASKLEILCPNGHSFKILYGDFKQKPTNCKHCNKENFGKWSDSDIASMIADLSIYGYELINQETYIEKDAARSIFVKCPEGHEVSISFNSFKNSNTRCSGCFGVKNHTLEFAKQKFEEVGYIPLFTEYINNKIPMSCLCKIHNDEIIYKRLDHVINGHGCEKCAYEARKGEGNKNWKGGITPLRDFMRRIIKPWVKDSLAYYNYNCVILEKRVKNLAVHHLHNFSLILEECLHLLKIELKENINLYSSEELELLSSKCLKLHYKYGYGVPLESSIHDEFHKLFGKNNNTPEQFFEFKRIKQFEIKDAGIKIFKKGE